MEGKKENGKITFASPCDGVRLVANEQQQLAHLHSRAMQISQLDN